MYPTIKIPSKWLILYHPHQGLHFIQASNGLSALRRVNHPRRAAAAAASAAGSATGGACTGRGTCGTAMVSLGLNPSKYIIV